jgi:hypothetical protein
MAEAKAFRLGSWCPWILMDNCPPLLCLFIPESCAHTAQLHGVKHDKSLKEASSASCPASHIVMSTWNQQMPEPCYFLHSPARCHQPSTTAQGFLLTLYTSIIQATYHSPTAKLCGLGEGSFLKRKKKKMGLLGS